MRSFIIGMLILAGLAATPATSQATQAPSSSGPGLTLCHPNSGNYCLEIKPPCTQHPRKGDRYETDPGTFGTGPNACVAQFTQKTQGKISYPHSCWTLKSSHVCRDDNGDKVVEWQVRGFGNLCMGTGNRGAVEIVSCRNGQARWWVLHPVFSVIGKQEQSIFETNLTTHHNVEQALWGLTARTADCFTKTANTHGQFFWQD